MIPLETIRLSEVNFRLDRNYSIQKDEKEDIVINSSMKFNAKDSSLSFVDN
jgi:hypothetical protein